MFLLFLSCSDPPPSKTPETGVVSHDLTWVMGEVQVCDAPVEVGWSQVDVGTMAFAKPENTMPGPIEPGAVVWWEDAAGFQILSSSPQSELLQQRVGVNVTPLAAYNPIRGMLRADLDGDGFLDLITAEHGVLVRYHFSESETEEVLLTSSKYADQWGINVGDIDGDGDLDVVSAAIQMATPFPPYIILRNEGNRVFSTETIDVDPNFWGVFFDARLVDMDEDGDLDILTCNDRGNELIPNGLLANDGTGHFEIASDHLGLAVPAHCMGLSFGDVNRDGVLDEYIGDAEHNWLLLSSDDGYYDAGPALGLPNFQGHQMVWGNAVVDMDNDGLADLVTNVGDFYMAGAQFWPLTIYRQQADGQFSSWTPIQTAQAGRGLVVQDYNLDGVPDLLVGQAFQSPQLFVSNGCSAGNWLEVEAPTGSTVRVRAGDTVQAALATVEHSWQSSGPSVVHFGLGEVDTVDAIEIHLPGGVVVSLPGPIAARQRVAFK